MNKFYRLVAGAIFVLFAHHNLTACGFEFVGSCASAVRFTANGVTKDYFVTTCAYGNSLGGSSIGTGLTNFQLSSTTTVTWESCTNILQESNAFYRVFSNPANKGTFQKVPMSQQSINTNSPPYRTRTYSNNLSIDLLAGLLPNTTYTFEIYYQIGADSDGNGSVDQTKVYDNNGSYFSATFQTGNIAVNSGFPTTITTQNAVCNGGTGSATASASGGTAPYSYAWSNGATGASITNLAAGFYSVTATDATAAKSIKSFSITEPSAVTASLSTTNASCGSTNGTIGATASGGTSPYTFLWSNNATTATLTNLQAGVYGITVTDSKGCKGSSAATLTENCGGNGSYCTSTGSPWSEWVANVQFNTLNNNSEKTRPDRFVAGYSDWTDKATTVLQGTSYPLSITPGLSWSGQQTNLYFRAWIDFNRNGIFEDTEKVLEKNATSLAVNNTVLIPATASIGTTVMRISMKKDSYATPCEAFAAGEVEDYSVVINAGNGDPCATDNVKPVLSACPSNINLTTATTCATATWTAPTATDNCTTTPSVSSTYASGFCFPIGTTNVVYTATDAKNNTATCSFSVTVAAGNPCANDVIKPVLSACPSNIGLVTATTCAAATWIAPTATDNCTATPSVSSTYASGFCFPIGTTTVVYTATDAKNNTATCSFNVTVIGGSCSIDVIKPVLSACPANVNLTSTKTCEAVTWTPPTATDNCTATPSVSSTISSGFCFPIGTTNVVYTATDAANNSSTCSFSVSVVAGTSVADLSLTVTSLSPTFSKWTTSNFKVTAKNVGTTPFSSAKIEFKYPTGTVNGGGIIPSVGVWEEWCAGSVQCFTWTIPALAANATATLDLPLFVLDVTTPITATAKLLSSTPADNVSTNNTASVTINPIANGATVFSTQKATQLVPIVVQNISPSFTEGDVFIELESLVAKEVDFVFSDALGKVVKVDKRAIEKGSNLILFDVWNLPQGVYFVVPTTNVGHNVPTKFVKL